ncbi:MAG: hypothetical protein V2I43_23925 [Parvularcula sp.]|jgi:hypothetical protein|nr:hypothetical protein [Parvularcula sp.]
MTAGSPDEVDAVKLYDIQARTLVSAERWSPITDKNLMDWQTEWMPELIRRLKLLQQAGVELARWPQSMHWNWRQKVASLRANLSQKSYALVHDGMTQAMMAADLGKRARIDSQRGQHLVYIDYIEAAPWNRHDVPNEPVRLGGCGTQLILTAIGLSKMEGFKGRIGLHSLPQANDYYRNTCGMEDLGADTAAQNLRYFEMTPEIAEAFLLGKGKGE